MARGPWRSLVAASRRIGAGRRSGQEHPRRHRHHPQGKAADQLQRACAARPAAQDGPAGPGRGRRRSRHATATGRRIRTSAAGARPRAEARTPCDQHRAYRNSRRPSASRSRKCAPAATRTTSGRGRLRPRSTARPTSSRMIARRAARPSRKDEKPKLQGNGLERRYLSDPPRGLLKAQGGRRSRPVRIQIRCVDPDSPLGLFAAQIRQQDHVASQFLQANGFARVACQRYGGCAKPSLGRLSARITHTGIDALLRLPSRLIGLSPARSHPAN